MQSYYINNIMIKKSIYKNGSVFNRLTLVKELEPVFKYGRNNRVALFKCVCGNEISRDLFTVIGGRLKSCGCLGKESRKTATLTHGMSYTKFYKAWEGMKKRCYGVNQKNYKNYGGRGIAMCDEWRNDFLNFKKDMYKSYLEHVDKFGKKNTTIDRIDNDGGYCKSNCRWATNLEQSYNRRCARLLTLNGRTLNIVEWGKVLGISWGTIWSRIDRGWSVKKALTKAVRVPRVYIINGVKYTMSDMCKKTGFSRATLEYRIKKWGLVEEVISKPLDPYDKTMHKKTIDF